MKIFWEMEGNCGDYRPRGFFSPLTWNYYYGLPASTLVHIQLFSALSSAWPCKSGQGLKPPVDFHSEPLQRVYGSVPDTALSWCGYSPLSPSATPASLLHPPPTVALHARLFSLLTPFPPSGLHHPGHPISKLHPVPLPNLILALLSVTTFIICDTFYLFWYILFW